LSARIPTGATVRFNDPDTGRMLDGRIVEHKVTSRGHRYRVRISGLNKRTWLDAKDLVI
jgi:hypothetical protein